MMLSFIDWIKQINPKKHPNHKYLLYPINMDLPKKRFMSGDYKVFDSREERDNYIASPTYHKIVMENYKRFCEYNAYKKKYKL